MLHSLKFALHFPLYKTLMAAAYNFANLKLFRLKFSMLNVCLRLNILQNLSQDDSAMSQNEARGTYVVLMHKICIKFLHPFCGEALVGSMQRNKNTYNSVVWCIL